MVFMVCVGMLLCIAVAFTCLVGRRIEDTLAPALFLMILILYVSGLCGNLMVGEYIITGLSAVALLYVFYTVLIGHDWNKIKLIGTPGFVAFLIFLLINGILCKGRMLVGWDEFSHWGRVPLNMYHWNRLGNCEGSTVMFPGYPPAVSLWQYFFVSLRRKFSEPYLFGASNVLAFVMLIPVYRKIEWKQWRKALFLLGTIFLFPLPFYNTFWSSILVDGILGIWMIYILYTYYSVKENTAHKTLCISLALGTYPLVKASGSGLAILVLLIIAADILVCCRQQGEWKQKIKNLIIYTSSVFIGKLSWSWYLKLSNTRQAWNTSPVTMKNIVNMLKGNGKEWQYTTSSNFIKALFFGRDGFHAFHWMLIIVFLTVMLYVLHIWNKKQLFLYSGGFLLCGTVYSLSLMILYCFTFTETEAVSLASYSRYMGSFFLGVFGFCICVLASESSGVSEKVMLAILLCLMAPYDSIRLYSVDLEIAKRDMKDIRAPYENLEEFSKFMDWERDKVWLIDQGDTGYLHVLGGYCATPVTFSPEWGWSLGDPLYEGDVWTVNYSAEEWKNKLMEQKYTYVYINHQDEQFVAKYGELFENSGEIEDKALYRICYDKAGGIYMELYREY